MKPLKTKAQIRDEIQRQIAAYINEGGNVAAIPQGTSGREPTTQAPLPISFDKTHTERTPVTAVISAIEERRHNKGVKKPLRRANKPRKKLIYDDFGQPLRWQWVEE
jgi:hypothetical protein